MKFLAWSFFIFAGLQLRAESVQVPESCVGNKSPCVLRAEDTDFSFKQSGYRIELRKQSIVKLVFDSVSLSLELLEGRARVYRDVKPVKISVQGLSPAGDFLVAREGTRLQLLSLQDFYLGEYNTTGNRIPPQKVKSEFVSKADFVEFGRFYFDSSADFKKFLSAQQEPWKKAFAAENASQTKVLMRSVASVDREARRKESENKLRASELKKVRDEFFYRTFER